MQKFSDNRRRAVLWDLDGVLIDSVEAHHRSWCKALEGTGLSMSLKVYHTQFFGMNNYSTVETLLGHTPSEEMADSIISKKEQSFRDLIPEAVRLMPGAHDWLEQFRQAGLVQAVASSAPLINIRAVMETMAIGFYFTLLVSGEDLPSKPDPAIFLKTARGLGVRPARCLVIEDSIVGIASARAAGMKCLAVETSFPREQLIQATKIIKDLTELDEATVRGLLQ